MKEKAPYYFLMGLIVLIFFGFVAKTINGIYPLSEVLKIHFALMDQNQSGN